MNENSVKLSVYGILQDKTGQILMQKRSHTSYANGWWSLPGGHVEFQEAIGAALQREILEELNVRVTLDACSNQLTLVRKPQEAKRYINFFYVIKEWEGVPVIADNKASKLSFVHPAKLPEQTLPYIQEALMLIEQGIQFYESKY